MNLFKKIYRNRIFFYFFFIFVIYYILNFNSYNETFATDYQVRYKPNGNNLVDILKNFELSNLDFSSIFLRSDYNFLNPYLIPELITGLILNLTQNENIFSIFSNTLNIVLLFLSFYIFFKTLNIKNKEKIIFFFLIFFFIYIGNWVWCFWKLADIYFLFVFSLVFFFLLKAIEKKTLTYILYSFVFVCISLFTKPQALAVIPFFIFGILLLFFKKFNFFKFIILSLIFYSFFFPLVSLFLMKINHNNPINFPFFVHIMKTGLIYGDIFFTYENFLKDFSLNRNNFSELLYYYFLFSKKIFLQMTFLRETYSFKHNFFLFFYTLVFYFFLIVNLNYFIKKYEIFFKLIMLITFFSLLMGGSLVLSAEPNRHQLFYLTPLYILVSISIQRIYNNLIFVIKYTK